MDIKVRIGKNVQRIRRSNDQSQEELAFEAGLHRTYISGIERGIRNPTATVIERVSKALKVKPAELFE